jgi:hypothetical protein
MRNSLLATSALVLTVLINAAAQAQPVGGCPVATATDPGCVTLNQLNSNAGSYVPQSALGQPGGVATLNNSGQVPASQLPSGNSAGTYNPAGQDLSAGAVTATGSTSARTLGARSADVFNVKDYGAIGSAATGQGSSTTIGSALPSMTAAQFQSTYPFATNPQYGLSFTFKLSANIGGSTSYLPLYTTYMSSSVANNNNLNLLNASYQSFTIDTNSNGTDGGWQAIAPEWIDPRWAAYNPAQPNNVIKAGMSVSDSGGCIASGTTVFAVGNDPTITGTGTTGAPAYGTISLSQGVAPSGCSQNDTLTFSVPFSAIKNATMDWLGIQMATYAADQAGGGKVYMPTGSYRINMPVRRSSSFYGGDEFAGDGRNATYIYSTDPAAPATSTLGSNVASSLYTSSPACAFMPSRTDQGDPEQSSFHDFTLINTQIHANNYGLPANTTQSPPAYGDGLCVGPHTNVRDLSAQYFRAGISSAGDHIKIVESGFAGNAYGIYIPPFQNSNGALWILNTYLTGNALSGIAVSPTSQIDSSFISSTHLGFSPFGILYEGFQSLSGVPNRSVLYGTGAYYTGSWVNGSAFLTNNRIESMFVENVGNCVICGLGETGQVTNNLLTSGGAWYAGASYGSSPFYLTNFAVSAPIYVNNFSNNVMLGTGMANIYGFNSYAGAANHGLAAAYYGANGPASLVRGYLVQNNRWIEDVGIASFATSSFAPIEVDSSPANMSNNSFEDAVNGSGVFKWASSSISAAGLPLSLTNYGEVGPFSSGGNFAGVSASASASGNAGIIGVIQKGLNIGVSKANASETINPASGQGVVPSVGGFTGASSGQIPVGVATNYGGSGSSVVRIDLDSVYHWHN